ncbi:type II toxin-antitoxin system Phd/YefM family antitoxin [Longimicrobium sp.]|uniref:type II toxin-antitoxin system Phd/YefM family antitoxin n=1 Tax=Longimicrobium sp. TaxID=2029185 RepID=UPI002E33269E|nr:type II toxin-antitoxin system Phd/YefM family antitoxin [Longimicrobium sp.]HEX6041102.1 type II toxin-antitoxin system Phd/YefM family antitoxin [Longimicrobium sp.]
MPDASVTDVARNFSEYVNRVAYGGEQITLMRGGKPMARLIPVARGVRAEDLPALFASLPRLAPDEAEAFARDLESGRPLAGDDDFSDPWGS